MTSVPPIRREVLVDAPAETAFAVFTEQIGGWWPLVDHAVHGDGTVAFVDGRIVETSAEGEDVVWGTVTDWEPPSRVAFTWHPGYDASRASAVEVTFAPSGSRTRVTLLHTGWEAFDDPIAAHEEYEQGWPTVLQGYADSVAASAVSKGGDEEDTWVALMHSAADGVSGSVFADERFARHLEFLGRMSDAGYLVAAGSLPDEDGDGMTILRLPGTGRFEEARLLAESDGSVTGGLFTVRVRPWSVVLHR
jgi:uncharacterized protein YndB with AHSA1/START domain/uncharacterized protein YciI